MGITQARPTNARSIFPCFDEPSFKASFSLEMSRPANYNTYFNVELLETVADGYVENYLGTWYIIKLFYFLVFSVKGSFGTVLLTLHQFPLIRLHLSFLTLFLVAMILTKS